MSTHQKVKDQLDRSIKAHQRAHHDHLEAAGLAEHAEATISPLGPEGDLGATPGGLDE